MLLLHVHVQLIVPIILLPQVRLLRNKNLVKMIVVVRLYQTILYMYLTVGVYMHVEILFTMMFRHGLSPDGMHVDQLHKFSIF